MYVGKQHRAEPFLHFGYFFVFVGATVLIQSVSFFKRLKKDGGALLFKFSPQGIELAPGRESHHQIPMDSLEKSLTRGCPQSHRSRRNGYFKESAVFWLGGSGFGESGLIENAKNQRSRADDGELFTVIKFPAEKKLAIIKALEKYQKETEILEELSL